MHCHSALHQVLDRVVETLDDIRVIFKLYGCLDVMISLSSLQRDVLMILSRIIIPANSAFISPLKP